MTAKTLGVPNAVSNNVIAHAPAVENTVARIRLRKGRAENRQPRHTKLQTTKNQVMNHKATCRDAGSAKSATAQIVCPAAVTQKSGGVQVS